MFIFLFALIVLPQEPGPPGYSIPVIDLDSEFSRHIEVDKEPGQYLGHVTTAMLEDGKTIFAVYPKGHGKGAIVMKRSDDGGETWSARLPTPKSWADSEEVPTLYRTIDKQGKKRFILFSGLRTINRAYSEDDGKTWSELEPIGDYGGIVSCADMERTADGRYFAMFHDDGRFMPSKYTTQDGHPFHVYQIWSEDGGMTWGTPRTVASHPKAHLCEPGIIRSPDGSQLAALFRENSRKYNGFVMFSEDEGETWSQPRQLPAALTGDRHTAQYAPDGRLFISFRDTTRESITQGDWVGWVGSFEDIVDGREGQYRIRLKDNKHRWDCAYPGVEILPDGTFVCTTYGHWTEGQPPWILSVRFKLDDLDALLSLAPPDKK